MKGDLEKQKEVLRDIVTMLRQSYGVTKQPILKFVGEEIIETIKLIDEANKEFPIWTPYRACPKIDYKTKEPIDVEEKYREEVFEWFVKYFWNSRRWK